jgi:phage shock protein A
MGLFQRLGTLIKSNINDLISKAEDPEKMLSQVLVDMKNQLVEAKKQVAVAIGDEKRLKKQWDDQVQQKDAVEKLKDQLRTLNNKIEEAKRKKNILVARAKRAEAQKTIQATMAGLSDTSAFETFDRMAEKVEQAEAEAEAGVELAGEMTGDTLQSRFKQLENTGGADMALQELKAKMGLGPATTAPRKELPASKEGEGGAAKPKEAAGGGSKDE